MRIESNAGLYANEGLGAVGAVDVARFSPFSLGNCPPPSGSGANAGTFAGAASAAAVGVGAGVAVATGAITAVTGGLLAPIAPIVGLLIANAFQPDYCKIDTSNAANEIASQMDQNVAAWRAIPCDQRYQSVAAAYEQTFQNLYQSLVNFCSNPIYGQAGTNCIADRAPGGKYDMRIYDLYPISQDPCIKPDPPAVSASSTGTTITTGVSDVTGQVQQTTLPGWLLPAVLAVAALTLFK